MQYVAFEGSKIYEIFVFLINNVDYHSLQFESS